jgi:hypothetical protein
MIKLGDATTTITVRVDPATVPGRVGKIISFDIYISGIDEVVGDLFAWELRVNWTDINFNFVTAKEGPFLKQGGVTAFITPILSTFGAQETLALACSLVGYVPGVRGEGVLATVSLYVIAGQTGDAFTVSGIKLRNSVLDPIWPPYIPPGQTEPKYDVILLDEAGIFLTSPLAADIEPEFGVIDTYDLGVVANNYLRNVTRLTKIPTSWAAAAATGWSNPERVGASDDFPYILPRVLHAASATTGASTKWMTFRFNTTVWTGVNTVEVGLERWIDPGSRIIRIELSNDNGTSWSQTYYDHTVADTSDTMVWIDVTGAYAWTKAMVDSIAVKITYQSPSPITIRIDYLAIRVTPTPVLGPPEVFDPDADVNNDRIVDVDDLVLVATSYGEHPFEEEE